MSNRPPRWLVALIVLISLPLLLPFICIIERAADVGLARSIELLWRPRMWELLSNTLLLMVFVTIFAIILGTLCAFLLERYRFWGKGFSCCHDASALYSCICQLFYLDQSHL